MSKKPKPPSLTELSRQPLTVEDIDAWKQEMTTGTDHSCALIGAAFIDQVLQQAVASHFRSDLQDQETQALFESAQAPISSLASRTSVAYALGHFGASERDDLKVIRHIRNAFAHSPRPIQFDHPLIERECLKLRSDGRYGIPTVSKARSVYIVRCLELVLQISQKTMEILAEKRDRLSRMHEGLKSFATSLKDPSNPLHPDYRGAGGRE